MVLVDEAYYHFYGETVMDLVGKVPNLIVARTFSKAYGLAGLRLGMLAAGEEQHAVAAAVISPYSVNSLALACLPAALEDEAYLEWYVGEVMAARDGDCSRAGPDSACSTGLAEANFVLTRIGATHTRVCAGDASARRAVAGPLGRSGLRWLRAHDRRHAGADAAGGRRRWRRA